MQNDAARNNQQQQPIERESQRDPAQRDGYADIQRIAGSPEDALGDEHNGGL